MRLAIALPFLVMGVIGFGLSLEKANAELIPNNFFVMEGSGFAVTDEFIQNSEINLLFSTGDQVGSSIKLFVEDGFVTLQAKKGNEWFFGMKMHIGVDEALGIVHSFSTTAANVHDITQAANLLHGEEACVWGDAGYQGVHKRSEHEDRKVDWLIAIRPGKRRQLNPRSIAGRAEKAKASVRAKVEHPFRYVKRMFAYDKVRYRGLAKNTERISLLLGFANLLIAERYEWS